MNYLILFYFLISAIPGIYLATKKYFLVILNPKYNRFIIRLLYCVPSLTPFVLVLSLFPLFGFDVYFNNFSQILVEKFTIYIALLCPLLTSLLFIIILKKYFIRTDIPPEFWPNFMNHELYVFIPHIRIIGGSYYHTRFEYPKKREPDQLLIGKQIGNLILDFKKLKDINYTSTGEFVISEKVLDIFQKNNLTGYQIQPVLDYNKSSSSELYYQIIPKYTMPLFSSETSVHSKKTPQLRVFVLNDLFYYNSCV
ncbi:MAG: hypothetical protein FWH46_04050, partial [Methanimicrococcus sp.]|nr:hypothetical protein [Methanimicrococcus sp.]